jgi:hypothetical protein
MIGWLFKAAKRVDTHWPYANCYDWLEWENPSADGERYKLRCSKCGKWKKIHDPTRGFQGLNDR